jgi:hypothetical protein
MAEDFEGDWISQVGPNLSGNRRPFHVVDGIQGLSSDRGGRGVVGQAVGNLDYPGVSSEGRLEVLGTADDAGILGLAGLRKAGPTFPFPPPTVMFPREPDPIDPPAKNVIDLPNVVIHIAGVVGIVREDPTKTPAGSRACTRSSSTDARIRYPLHRFAASSSVMSPRPGRSAPAKGRP